MKVKFGMKLHFPQAAENPNNILYTRFLPQTDSIVLDVQGRALERDINIMKTWKGALA